MTEIEKLKIEAANLFFIREKLQLDIDGVNQRLQGISSKLHQLTKEQGQANGDPEEA